MRKTTLLTAVILTAAISGAPQLAAAMGGASPSSTEGSSQKPPSKPSGKSDAKKNKKDKSSSAKDFIDGYHAAYALIYDKDDYQGGITALRALEHDNNADVATLLGYASRKLGRYDDAKYWYDKALAADPAFATNVERVKRRGETDARVAAVFGALSNVATGTTGASTAPIASVTLTPATASVSTLCGKMP